MKNVLLALGLLVAAATFGSFGAWGAANDAPGADVITPTVMHGPSTGSFGGDLRHLPQGNAPIRDDAQPNGKAPDDALHGQPVTDTVVQSGTGTVVASAPSSGSSFQGLDHTNWGAGWPPDPNSDVGPNDIVETVNTSIGIFDKSGTRLAATTFDSLWSTANTGTPCDNSNQGDPVALYDPIGDRFIVTDFAWSNFSSGPFYQCIAVSKTGDPVSGGWWFYAWQTESGASLPDYPKLGVWPDGIYMSANVFSSTGSESFQNVQVWAFNRQQMEAGDPSPQAVTASLARTVGGVSVFSLLPSNARSVTGLPPAGTPNYFTSIWGSYAIRVWKFHVDWTNTANSTFTGPTNVGIASFNPGPSDVPEASPGNPIDTLSYRLMMQNQYTNIGGQESLWLTHTVGNSSQSVAQVRWYQLPVTGGTIASSPRQQSTWAPDGSSRFMPSLAVDKNGDMAIGYSVSSSSMYPALRYSGRLATDTLSQLTQGETTLVQGLGYQCCTFSDGSTNSRWGDYSSMTIDPDGCTFWYTGEYYDAHPTTKADDDWLTRIGSFQLPGCSGTVTPPAAPSITNFSPTSGPAGTTVTINGSGFTGTTGVTFGGAAASFSIVSDSQLTAMVPANATTGPIGVTAPGGSTTSAASFTVTTAASAPTISGFTPTSGKVGIPVTISGTNLTGTSSVTFGGGVTAAPTSNTATQVTVNVPSGAKNGPLTVTTPNGSATSSQTFRVVKH
jgi:IPT/TIG domain-containing protein